MFRMNGMSRAHGCAGLTMFRMNGSSLLISDGPSTIAPALF
ncbi:MAG: hypothetical protein ACI9YO_001195 [Gammaproteobacteria bacterium]|jgi:hypothetical protein